MAQHRYSQWMLNAATVLVTLAALSVAGVRVRDAFTQDSNRDENSPRTRHVSEWRKYAVGGVRLGSKNAPVTIVEFLDFQCPFCRVAAADLRDLRRWFGDDLAIIYRQLPVPSHRFAYPAALAAECAAQRGSFEKFHDALFEQPDSIGRKPWTHFAIEADIKDTSEFRTCMNRPSIAAAIAQDAAAAATLGATGTPTFLVNDLMISGNPGLAALNQYVKEAIKASKK
jgi:protein-disulfide isomerase